MRLKITQHGVSCNECDHQGFKPDHCTRCMKRRVGQFLVSLRLHKAHTLTVFEHYFLSIYFYSNCIYIYIYFNFYGIA